MQKATVSLSLLPFYLTGARQHLWLASRALPLRLISSRQSRLLWLLLNTTAREILINLDRSLLTSASDLLKQPISLSLENKVLSMDHQVLHNFPHQIPP